jgi:rSAM/selenodomain-associated transferase 1
VNLKSQAGKDLGERMHHSVARALRRHKAVIVIGTDCPALTPRDLRRAVRLLRGGCEAVLAPAEDGGYALIGLTKVSPRLFSGIAWGTSAVYEETARRLAAAGYRWRALRTVWDVDRPEDLERLRSLRFS